MILFNVILIICGKTDCFLNDYLEFRNVKIDEYDEHSFIYRNHQIEYQIKESDLRKFKDMGKFYYIRYYYQDDKNAYTSILLLFKDINQEFFTKSSHTIFRNYQSTTH